MNSARIRGILLVFNGFFAIPSFVPDRDKKRPAIAWLRQNLGDEQSSASFAVLTAHARFEPWTKWHVTMVVSEDDQLTSSVFRIRGYSFKPRCHSGAQRRI
jgi:hypothetical protein